MARSLLSILVGLWLITCFAAGETEPYVPALYVFGDSLADAGNNKYLPNSSSPADSIPYGVSYFPYPTGRYSDGRLTFDFLASYLGLPFAPPYLQPGANFTTGINFASAGSGLLDKTGNGKVLNMSYQVSKFEEYSDNLSEATRANLGNSLFGIIAGSNDLSSFVDYIFHPEEFVAVLLSKLNEYIMRLYKRGARKFIVCNIPPLGCTPALRNVVNLLDHGGCASIINSVIELYNSAFSPNLTELAKTLDEATIIQVNDYHLIMNIIENGEAYDFKNTTWSCCGSGNFGTQIICGQTDPPDMFCKDPSTYVFWDGIHGTEKVYRVISEQIWSGNTSVAYPFNVSTLVSRETYLISNNAPTLVDM